MGPRRPRRLDRAGAGRVRRGRLRALRRAGRWGVTPTVLHLFAGAGGGALGFARAGFRSVGAFDFDAHACAALEYRTPCRVGSRQVRTSARNTLRQSADRCDRPTAPAPRRAARRRRRPRRHRRRSTSSALSSRPPPPGAPRPRCRPRGRRRARCVRALRRGRWRARRAPRRACSRPPPARGRGPACRRPGRRPRA
ncbi:MAG: DNA cytosine methyltransferase [Myxococcales bacterium]|nr:DNA cytosine methyltransferase [Myxococcales bacterium]